MLRTSFDLKDFYTNGYIKDNQANFTEFSGFLTYDASYDYEMYETIYVPAVEPTDKPSLQPSAYMLENYPTVHIPQYLVDMKNQVNSFDQRLTNSINWAQQHLKLPRSEEYYRKLVEKGLLLLVKYKSSLPNGQYLLRADLSEL